MAITLQKKFSIDLEAIVGQAVVAATAVKKQESAKVEADFQKAVLDGTMSYNDQIAFRKQQIQDEQEHAYPDSDLIDNLNQSIKSLTRLNRFQNYREKYSKSYADLAAGRVTIESHLEMLKDSLNDTTDPDLKLEIQGEIVTAENDFQKYNDAILTNQIKLAQNDGTQKVLNETIAKVQSRRSMELLRGNEDQVTAMDANLSVLNSQLNKVKIEDTMNSAEIKGMTKGLTVKDKLDDLASQIAGADDKSPVTINGKNYSSAKEFWTATRDGYLAGNGTGIWKDAITELNNYYVNKVNAAVSRDGYATSMTLDSVKGDIDEIKSKPEVAAYSGRLDEIKNTIFGAALDSTAKMITDTAAYTGDFKKANTQLLKFEKDYGISLEDYRLSMANELTAQLDKQQVSQSESNKIMKDVGTNPETFNIPESKPTPIAPTATPQGLNTLKAYDKTGKVVYVTPGQKYDGVSLNPKATLYSTDGKTQIVETGSAQASDLMKNGWSLTKPVSTPAKPAAPAPAAPVAPKPATPVVPTKPATPTPATPAVDLKVKQPTVPTPEKTEIPAAVNTPSIKPEGTNTLRAYNKKGQEVYVTPGKYYKGVSLTKPKV